MFGMFGAFDPRFYPRVVRQSVGRSIGFLVVFVLIISALVSVKYTFVALSGLSAAKKWVDENMPRAAREFPVVSVKQGELIEPKQRFVKDYEKQFAIIIEPDPANVSAVMAQYPNLALLTRNQLITKQTTTRNASAEIKTYNLENRSFSITPGPDGFKLAFEQKRFDIVPRIVNRWIDIAGMFIFPVLLLFWFSVYTFTKPLHVLIFSLASMIIAGVLKTKFAYSQLWNIGVYALVPATCLAAAMDIMGLRFPFFALIYCIVYTTYLYLALRSVTVTPSEA
ncbi:MAG TPA: DUF1189 family protein [Candidatus Omnitrophota bacterium]|nr:DUF1189 family protein [Candidatus Omnitrophota bacterium]